MINYNIYSMKKAILILILLINTFGFSQQINIQKLDAFFKVLEDNHQFMGSVTLSQHNNIIYQNSIGYQNIEKQIKNNENSQYSIGSISKTFTAVLIFKAIENNTLSLNTTLDTFFPTIKNSSKITIEHLLHHRSGIVSFTNNRNYLNWNTESKTQLEMIEIIKKGGVAFDPDTKSKYSNSNFVLLSYILESVFKKPYADILKEYISTPLELKNTFFSTKKPILHSYKHIHKWEIQNVTNPTVSMGAGGIISNSTDLTRFSDALFHHQIISKESLEKMITLKGKYGMGIFKIPFYKEYGLGHNGTVDGFKSMFSYFKSKNLSVAITSNGDRQNINDIALTVLKEVFGKPYEILAFTTKNRNLDHYLGTYSSTQLPLKITIAKNNQNELTAQATGQSFFILEPTIQTHKFKFDAAGIVLKFNTKKQTMVFFQGGKKYLFTKE